MFHHPRKENTIMISHTLLRGLAIFTVMLIAAFAAPGSAMAQCGDPG